MHLSSPPTIRYIPACGRGAYEMVDNQPYQHYGLSETLVALTASDAHDDQHSDETPCASTVRVTRSADVRVVDDSAYRQPARNLRAVEVQGLSLRSGAWKHSDWTSEVMHDGWIRSRDMGRHDRE